MSHTNLTLVPHREEEEEEEGTRLPLRRGERGGHFTTVCGGRKKRMGEGIKERRKEKRTLLANVHHSSHYSKLRTAH